MRVTLVVLCVCLYVCLSIRLHMLFWQYAPIKSIMNDTIVFSIRYAAIYIKKVFSLINNSSVKQPPAIH